MEDQGDGSVPAAFDEEEEVLSSDVRLKRSFIEPSSSQAHQSTTVVEKDVLDNKCVEFFLLVTRFP